MNNISISYIRSYSINRLDVKNNFKRSQLRMWHRCPSHWWRKKHGLQTSCMLHISSKVDLVLPSGPSFELGGKNTFVAKDLKLPMWKWNSHPRVIEHVEQCFVHKKPPKEMLKKMDNTLPATSRTMSVKKVKLALIRQYYGSKALCIYKCILCSCEKCH